MDEMEDDRSLEELRQESIQLLRRMSKEQFHKALELMGLSPDELPLSKEPEKP